MLFQPTGLTLGPKVYFVVFWFGFSGEYTSVHHKAPCRHIQIHNQTNPLTVRFRRGRVKQDNPENLKSFEKDGDTFFLWFYLSLFGYFIFKAMSASQLYKWNRKNL